ncbi:MAG: DUF2794 domain-containing protein [Alphaproteobacteria bacterium]
MARHTKSRARSAQKLHTLLVFFSRSELDQILRLYGRRVAKGEWRDYAIDSLADRAVFSIFRRSSEVPLFRVEKHPRLARRQGAYQVVCANGQILKRGRELANVLKCIDRRANLAVV